MTVIDLAHVVIAVILSNLAGVMEGKYMERKDRAGRDEIKRKVNEYKAAEIEARYGDRVAGSADWKRFHDGLKDQIGNPFIRYPSDMPIDQVNAAITQAMQQAKLAQASPETIARMNAGAQQPRCPECGCLLGDWAAPREGHAEKCAWYLDNMRANLGYRTHPGNAALNQVSEWRKHIAPEDLL